MPPHGHRRTPGTDTLGSHRRYGLSRRVRHLERIDRGRLCCLCAGAQYRDDRRGALCTSQWTGRRICVLIKIDSRSRTREWVSGSSQRGVARSEPPDSNDRVRCGSSNCGTVQPIGHSRGWKLGERALLSSFVEEDETMTAVDDAFRRARIQADRHMAACEQAGLRWSEPSITEIVMAYAARAVTVVPFTQPAEALSGADWVWWWVDSAGAYGMLVQTKRVTVTGGQWSFDFDYKARRAARSQRGAARRCLRRPRP